MQERKKNRFLLNIQYCLVADIEHLNLETTKKQKKQTIKYGERNI